MPLRAKTTILFDLDGTLTDPAEGIFACINYALEKMDIPAPDKNQLRAWIGPPLRTSFSNWLKTKGTVPSGTVPDANLAVKLYRQRFTDIGLFENTTYPGIEALLESLQRQGKQLFVATAKPTVFAKRILEHFGLDRYFVEIHGAELDGRNTNKVDLLGEMINTHQLKPQDCIMIGDRAYDIEAAKAYTIANIGVLWGYGERKELETAGADYIVQLTKDLKQLLIH